MTPPSRDSTIKRLRKTASDRKENVKPDYDAPVSLAPLAVGAAVSALLAIPDPDATKPKHAKKGATE